jgi:hypothetical protein
MAAMVSRCPKHCKPDPIPPSMTIEAAAHHPGLHHLLEPGAQCELEPGHGDGTPEHDEARRHRNGGLVWWDPPLFAVGGRQ